MNRYARALGLESTNFANPHGLSHKNNKSTAADIGKLACIAMQDPIVRDIVNKSISFFYIDNLFLPWLIRDFIL